MLAKNFNVLSARSFGSYVRGDSDHGSDIDILIVTDPLGGISKSTIDAWKAKPEVDFSIYTKERIEEMFREGHLFAWHLYLESRSLAEDVNDIWFNELGSPAPYKESATDILNFLEIFSDAVFELRTASDYIFEAGICHLALRNLGMIISFALTGRPNFSRFSALALPSEFRPPIGVDDYDLLLLCRRISARADPSPPPSQEQVLLILAGIDEWIVFIKEKFDV